MIGAATIDTQTYSLFLLTALVLVLSRGPDTVLILSCTIATGQAVGVMTLLGTQAGNVVHALLAGLGMSSIMLLFPFAFDLLKYAGAASLVYLAVMAWRASAAWELETRLASQRCWLADLRSWRQSRYFK